MRIAMGHVDHYDDAVGAFARQLGLRSVQLHCPTNLHPIDGSWSVAELSELRARCEEDGLVLEGIENVPAEHFYKIQRGEPGRDAQIEAYQRTIKNMAAAGLQLLGYHFIVTYVWRTAAGAFGRGGARVTEFDLADAHLGNALEAYKLSPIPLTVELDADMLWQNHLYFLDAVLPTAEEHGVRLALHPDDPPVDTHLGGAARIFTSPEALGRALEQSRRSPAWGLNLCLGTVSEMGGEQAVESVIDLFGPEGKILYVHFRDVRGTVPRFAECFLGEGNLNPAKVVRRLQEVGFDGFIIDDHVPAMVGDRDTWIDPSPEAYVSRGRAHAIGYLQGILDCLSDP